MPVLIKIAIGMLAGLVGPFLLGYIPSSAEEGRLMLLWGPVIGGTMAYSLHRLKGFKERHGEFVWLLLSGALAGGMTGGIAFDLGYLTSVWHVAAGAGFGALVVACFWLEANWQRP